MVMTPEEPISESRTCTIFEHRVGEQIRVQLDDFEGRAFVNVRVWWQAEDGGDFRPTRKGITVAPERARPIAQAMLRLADLAESQDTAKQRR